MAAAPVMDTSVCLSPNNPSITRQSSLSLRKQTLRPQGTLTANAFSLSLAKKKKRAMPTPLSAAEISMARETWCAIVGEGGFVTYLAQLKQVMMSLQIPQQPVTTKLCEESFNAKNGQFSFGDALNLLEQCKTVHTRWLCKLHGKRLDDDLLEAFVAVGGSDDSTGEVDIAKMKSVVAEFNLNVNLDKIVAELDSEGNSNIHFDDFAGLLRERRKGARLTDDEQVMSVEGVDEGIGFAEKKEPVVLSAMAFLDEDADLEDQFVRANENDRSTRSDEKMSTRRTTMRRMTTRGMLPVVAQAPTPQATALPANSAAPPPPAANTTLPPIGNEVKRTSASPPRRVPPRRSPSPSMSRQPKHKKHKYEN